MGKEFRDQLHLTLHVPSMEFGELEVGSIGVTVVSQYGESSTLI